MAKKPASAAFGGGVHHWHERPPPDSDLRIGFAKFPETQVQKLRQAK